MRRLLFALLLLWTGSSVISAQKLKTGLLINAGKGVFSDLASLGRTKTDGVFKLSPQYADKYKYNASLGYRFRLEPEKQNFFYDLDISVGLKSVSITFFDTLNADINGADTTYHWMISQDDQARFFASINASASYRLYKGLSVGLGIEPTYYFMTDEVHFDIPLTAKLSYDWKHLGVAFIYKYGFTDVMKSKQLTSGKFRDWQISLFIPF